MKKFYFVLVYEILMLAAAPVFSQQINFNHVLGTGNNQDPFLGIVQDKQGFMWFSHQLKGLIRYDGLETKSYLHDPSNPNSLADNWVECIAIDKDNILWLGTFGSGLDRFDKSTGTFTHFRHNDKDRSGLLNDTITALLVDRSGNLWVGSQGGLDLVNKQTGQCTHYANHPNDAASLSCNDVRIIYEDRAGIIWVGCGRPFNNLNQDPAAGGLNRFNKTAGTFTRYMHDPKDPNSIASNKVRAIFEDSKGNFWIGTRGDGLHIMDRNKGTFTHFYYDSTQPGKLSRPVQYIVNGRSQDFISFITETPSGLILIGTHFQGINCYDPVNRKMIHYGTLFNEQRLLAYDTITGLKDSKIWQYYVSKDGIMWISTLEGSIYNINSSQTYIPYYSFPAGQEEANTFFSDGNYLWIGIDQGLIGKDLATGEQKLIKHDPANPNSLCNDTITTMKVDSKGIFWIGTSNGICKYDPGNNTFTRLPHAEKNSPGLSSNLIHYIFIDHNQNIWIGTDSTGVDKLDAKTGSYTNYRYVDAKYKNSLTHSTIASICEDHQGNIWIGSAYGLNRLHPNTGKIDQYIPNAQIKCVFADAAGIIWVATPGIFFRFDSTNNLFQSWQYPGLQEDITEVINIEEDKDNNLWLSTRNSIIKINDKRDEFKLYDKSNNVHLNTFYIADNFVAKNGQVFIGDQSGYYAFYPNQIKDKNSSPFISITSFKISDVEISPGKRSALDAPTDEVKQINLNYDQGNFSFDFTAISYTSTGDKKFLFKLENYDNTWHYIGTERRAYFFNIPPGKYIFHVKVINADGATAEKIITIVVTPPWYKTLWAYGIFAFLFITLIWGFIKYRSRKLSRENRILEEKIIHRTNELRQQKEKVETTLSELKSTQTQLIQSEKMASLGELTAGIAHEIQNPLNFVNNFSEVSNELIVEMVDEIKKGNTGEAEAIAKDIKENLEKINHHGKRADAIVKGMLQHSRSSNGIKEPTDINALCDEYLRLSYHGLRAKDKSFNATMNTDLDPSIGKINIISQDIGRVILNLLNNAFYAVNEKKKQQGNDYEPIVTVSTKKINNKVEISVKDNGNGIPQKVLDKIFQPFFTTKPTGQGTGLGLSLSYDIITKGHNGELKIQTKEGEFAEFIITL